MIIILRKWKIQLTMLIKLISSKDSDETRNLYTKSKYIEIKMGNETNEVIKNVLCLFHRIIKKI